MPKRREEISQEFQGPARLSDFGSLELTEEIIRKRAYRFFEERGYEHGHDVEDWLKAEAEIMGKKPAHASLAAEPFYKVAAA